MKTIRSTLEERDALLGKTALFGPLAVEMRRPLARAAMLREVFRGECLFRQDEPATGFFVITAGHVNVLRRGPGGHEQILRTFSRGDVCAEVPVFQGKTYPASGYAATAVRFLHIPADVFRSIALGQPGMLLDMLAALSIRLREFVSLIDDLSLKNVPARAAKFMLDSAVHQGVRTFRLPVAKSVMAARIGTVPETLSRALARMRADGIIDMQGRSISILDRDRLIKLAAGMPV